METNKDILVIGGGGWIGKRIYEYLNCEKETQIITKYSEVTEILARNGNPKVVINCAGSFGHNVDDCEKDISNTIDTLSKVPIYLAEAAIRNNFKLVHISSGCIFNYDYKEDRPIKEDQAPDYFNLLYSRAKIYAEAALNAIPSSVANILQLRIRMPLDYIPHKRNLLSKLLTFNSVIDLPNSVTYLPDFLDALKHLLKIDAEGIYNVVNYGGLRHKELLEEYRMHNPNHQYAIMDLAELKLARTNLILSTDRLEESGFSIRDIHDVLPECVRLYVEEVKKSGRQLL